MEKTRNERAEEKIRQEAKDHKKKKKEEEQTSRGRKQNRGEEIIGTRRRG